MIRFEKVTFEYNKGNPVIKEWNLHITKGECVGLIGANGAGKSTFMKLLLGLLSGQGKIFVDGVSVEEKNLPAIRKKMGFLLQNSDHQMFMPTVLEDMMFGLLNYGMSPDQAEKRVDQVLEKLELTSLKYKKNYKISGGEKRMAAIATILAMEPEVILMDEPTTALDPYNRRIVINTIGNLTQTKIIASHDLDMIYETCERVILISGGIIAADGPAKEVLKDQFLLERNRMELPLRFQT